jgi:hypothetical protein
MPFIKAAIIFKERNVGIEEDLSGIYLKLNI